jgi:hypothetical protein
LQTLELEKHLADDHQHERDGHQRGDSEKHLTWGHHGAVSQIRTPPSAAKRLRSRVATGKLKAPTCDENHFLAWVPVTAAVVAD